MEEKKKLKYIYRFKRGRHLEKEFVIELEADTLRLVPVERKEYPDWTRLDYEKCSHCPLNSQDSPRCPAAVAVIDAIDFFKDRTSYDEYEIEVIVPERVYRKTTALQYGASALTGLLMAVSGCPVMGRLKPMARTHLPFGSMEETLYRAISMYFFEQYFKLKRGEAADWDLKRLVEIYNDVEKVNKGFLKRIKAVHTEDSGLNGIVHLDCYVRFANMAILDCDLQQISRYFEK